MAPSEEDSWRHDYDQWKAARGAFVSYVYGSGESTLFTMASSSSFEEVWGPKPEKRRIVSTGH